MADVLHLAADAHLLLRHHKLGGEADHLALLVGLQARDPHLQLCGNARLFGLAGALGGGPRDLRVLGSQMHRRLLLALDAAELDDLLGLDPRVLDRLAGLRILPLHRLLHGEALHLALLVGSGGGKVDGELGGDAGLFGKAPTGGFLGRDGRPARRGARRSPPAGRGGRIFLLVQLQPACL